MLIYVTVLILKHDLFNYFHIGNVNTQNNVDEPVPQLVIEPPPQGLFPLSECVMLVNNYLAIATYYLG